MRRIFILYNDTQKNILLGAKKLGCISIIDARHYEHRDTKEFLFNIAYVKGSKIVVRIMGKIIRLFSPKKKVSCEIIMNNEFEITNIKDL